MKSPTIEQVKAEVEKLKALKPRIKNINFFGESNHAAIDAQIEALEGAMTEEDIDAKVDSEEWDDRQRDNAFEAIHWMNGEEKESPSEGWKPLAKP